MFTWTPDLIQTLVQEGTGIHADVFKRVNAAYPYGVRLWDEDTGNTLEVRLCKSLDDAIYSAVSASMGRARVAGLIVEKSARGNPGDFSIADRIISRWKQNQANGNKMNS